MGSPPFPEMERQTERITKRDVHRNGWVFFYFLSILSREEEYKQFRYEVRIDLTSLV